jgi:hypothetical protein
MPVPVARGCSTANALGPRSGRVTARAVTVQGSRSRDRLPRSQSWRGRGWSGPSGQGCRRPGGRATVCMALIGGCGCGWRARNGRMCWQYRAKNMSGWAGNNGRGKRCWRCCPRRAGHDAVLAPGRQAPAGRPGGGCHGRLPGPPSGAAGCGGGAVGVTPRT